MSNQAVSQAAMKLSSGKTIDVEVTIAELALASIIPNFLNYLSPLRDDGLHAFSVFKKLCDNAGLGISHPALRMWFILRAITPKGGTAIDLNVPCPVSKALALALGAQIGGQSAIARIALNDSTASFNISDTPAGTGINTPGGFIQVNEASCAGLAGNQIGWKEALIQSEAVAKLMGRKAYDISPSAIVELDYRHPDIAFRFEGDAIHENWRPEIALHDDLKAHPASLIQSATLATVQPPKIQYKPRLTRHLISTGLISDAQFEAVAAAGEAHARQLPNGDRVGFILADGTGAGKTNTCLGIALDNNLKGRSRAIIVLEKRRHAPGFIDSWKRMNRSERDFIAHWDIPEGGKIPDRPGILLTTYSMIRQKDNFDSFSRIQQIVRWAGSEFEGPMIFDEAQNMRNAEGSSSLDGKSATSAQGQSGVEIQRVLPQARVVYATATAFTDVHNLAYCTRIGLWGENTNFNSIEDFIASFQYGTTSDLEQIMMSVKAAGCTISRNLSYDGVTQQVLPYTLTPNERKLFNSIAEMWSKVAAATKIIATYCGVPVTFKVDKNDPQSGKGPRRTSPFNHLTGMYESNRRRSMETVISSFKTRGVIEDIKRQLANNNCAVVQLQNTYEAQLTRMLDHNDNIDNIRLEPSELISYVDALPEHDYHMVISHHGKKTVGKYVPLQDAHGKPIVNAQAVALKADLIRQIKQIEMPLPPLDQLMMTFGTARIAEMTGRSKRIITVNPNGLVPGNANEYALEEREEKDRMRDVADFQAGKKKILVFSTGAGGSSLSYHAQRGSKNERRRVHYLVQLGYRADQVVQGCGRTHRSDEAVAPHYMIVTADLPADRLYASRIVSAMFRLGALSHGHRHAANNGMFEERDCLEGPYAEAAIRSLIADLNDQKLTGDLAHYTSEQFAQDVGIPHPVSPNVGMFLLNRIAALTDLRQNALFNELRERIDREIETAIANGRFLAGPETITAQSFEVISRREAEVDRVHKAKARIYRVRKTTEARITPFMQAHKTYILGRNKPTRRPMYARHSSSGAIALINPMKPGSSITGLFDMERKVEIITPTSTHVRAEWSYQREPWKIVPDIDAVEKYWNAAIEGAAKTQTSYITLVTDALLPVWESLRSTGFFKTNVFRLKTENHGALIGRPVMAMGLAQMTADLGLPETIDDDEVEAMLSHLKEDQVLQLASSTNSTASHEIYPVLDSNDQLVGIDLKLGNVDHNLDRYLSNLQGCQYNPQPNNRFQVTRDMSAIPEILKAIFHHTPVQFVDGMPLSQKQQQAQTITSALVVNA